MMLNPDWSALGRKKNSRDIKNNKFGKIFGGTWGTGCSIKYIGTRVLLPNYDKIGRKWCCKKWSRVKAKNFLYGVFFGTVIYYVNLSGGIISWRKEPLVANILQSDWFHPPKKWVIGHSFTSTLPFLTTSGWSVVSGFYASRLLPPIFNAPQTH